MSHQIGTIPTSAILRFIRRKIALKNMADQIGYLAIAARLTAHMEGKADTGPQGNTPEKEEA